jgi:hypothetical protein
MSHQNNAPGYSTRQVFNIAVGAGGTGLVVGLVGSSFSAAGIVSMTVAALMLLIAWIVGTVAITVSEPVWGLQPRYRLAASATAITVLTVILGGIGRFQYDHIPIVDRGTARVLLSGAYFEKAADQAANRVVIRLENNGNAIAIKFAVVVWGKLSDKTLSPNELAPMLEKTRQIVVDLDAQGFDKGILVPGNNQIVWLTDIDTKDLILLTDSQINDFNNAKLAIYAFIFARFEDETIKGSAYWERSDCVFFTQTMSYWHNCRTPQLDKISGSRFRN